MSEEGYGNAKWMLKGLIAHADARYLRFAVAHVVDALHDPEVTAEEILDMLTQRIVTGTYIKPGTEQDAPSEAVDALKLAEVLYEKYGLGKPTPPSEEQIEEEVEKFRDFLDDLNSEGEQLDD